jgi:hypothetical protein
MAFTVTKTPTVFGNKRAVMIEVSADGAEAEIESGLDVIEAQLLGAQSFASSSQAFKANEDSSGTAANGTIGISGVASGDEFFILCIGR